MNLYEYQAKNLLEKYGVPVPRGYLVINRDEIEAQARKIESDVAVIKAQVLAGGRGKAGGVRIAHTLTEALTAASTLLGSTLVTPQTGKKGVPVDRIYIEEGCSVRRELYIALTLDRAARCIRLIASGRGGMEIEELASREPEAVITMPLNPGLGALEYQYRRLEQALGIETADREAFRSVVDALVRCYVEMDCVLIEINPLAVGQDDGILALDAKMIIDDNAVFRHPELMQFKNHEGADPRETEASKHGLSFIALEGDIACLVNGAGLAMATMDAVKAEGGLPANFLDVGGSADVDAIRKAFEILMASPGVRGIFVNIFGGIMQCDTIANGIVHAALELGISVPIVVRLEGSRMQEGKDSLAASGLPVHSASSLDEGAALIARLVNERKA